MSIVKERRGVVASTAYLLAASNVIGVMWGVSEILPKVANEGPF